MAFICMVFVPSAGNADIHNTLMEQGLIRAWCILSPGEGVHGYALLHLETSFRKFCATLTLYFLPLLNLIEDLNV